MMETDSSIKMTSAARALVIFLSLQRFMGITRRVCRVITAVLGVEINVASANASLMVIAGQITMINALHLQDVTVMVVVEVRV
jgi:hypothetical protein